MNPAQIIERAIEDGVQLTLSPSGSISAKGDPSAIDRWLPEIKHNKAAIITELQLEHRRTKVRVMLRDNPSMSYAIEVADANTDPVIVSVGIRNVTTFEMNIPLAYYDAFSLMDLISNYVGGEHANA